jgi:c-di-GMP-binding flagellar brake protein YcgR
VFYRVFCRFDGVYAGRSGAPLVVWPLRCDRLPVTPLVRIESLTEQNVHERRQWPRLPLAIPIFVRSRDEKGKDFLEFATAMNVSAGGALVAVRRSLPHSTQVSLEIPTAPFLAAKRQSQTSRNMRARAVRVEHADGYQLVGLRFTRPLSKQAKLVTNRSSRRKAPATM